MRNRSKPQHARTAHNHRVMSGESVLSDAVIREHGSVWGSIAWQARLWSLVLIEIPKQVYEADRLWCAPFRARIAEQHRYYPDDPETDDIVDQANDAMARRERLKIAVSYPKSSSAQECTTASISRSIDANNEVRVEFAICRNGEISIRCIGTPPDMTKLPSFVNGPKSNEDAVIEAARLVRVAIKLVGG